MRITDSSVSLYGASTSVEKHTKEESLKIWVGDTRPNFEGENRIGLFGSPASQPAAQPASLPSDILQLSEEGKKALEEKMSAASNCVSCCRDEEIFELDDEDKRKIYLVQKMIEFLTGKKLKFSIPKRIDTEQNKGNSHHGTSHSNGSIQFPGASVLQPAQGLQRQGWGLEYDLQETHYEKQTMSFSSEGTVKTSDGREISFDLNLNLSREFASNFNISLRAGDAVKVDPLVVNFGNASATLTNE